MYLILYIEFCHVEKEISLNNEKRKERNGWKKIIKSENGRKGFRKYDLNLISLTFFILSLFSLSLSLSVYLFDLFFKNLIYIYKCIFKYISKK